jgi:replicative DNA helicase
VAFIYREELYRKDREDLKGLADLIVAKAAQRADRNRASAVSEPVHRFENRAEDLPEEV